MHPDSARLAFREMAPEDLDDVGLRPEKRARVQGGRDAIIYAADLDQARRP